MDQSIEKPSLVRNDIIFDFYYQFLGLITRRTLNSEPIDDNHVATKSYVDSLSENDRDRSDLSTVFNDQDNEFDKNKAKKFR